MTSDFELLLMAIRSELQVVGEKKEKHVYVLRKDKGALLLTHRYFCQAGSTTTEKKDPILSSFVSAMHHMRPLITKGVSPKVK